MLSTEPITASFGEYDAQYHPGSSELLIVSVASVGNVDAGTVPFDWDGTLGRVAGEAHVVMLRDRGGSWYNRVEGWDELVGFVRDVIERHPIRRTLAFGVSMGGYGAVALAGFLPLDRVVALGPQACVGAAAPFDLRYQELWSRTPHRWPHLADVPHLAREYVCCFTMDQPEDVRHAAELRRAIPRARLVAFRGEHNLGGEIAYRGQGDAFVTALTGLDPDFTRFGGFEAPPAVFGLADAALAGADPTSLLALAPDLPDAVAPAFLYPGIQQRRFEGAIARGWGLGHVLGTQAYPTHRGVTALADTLAPYLPYGWAPSSPVGTWSLGRWHAIRAEYLDVPARERANLFIAASVLVGEGHPRQRLRIHEAGRLLAEHVIEGAPGHVRCHFRVEAAGPLLDLVIETPDAVSPAATGQGIDERELGLLVWRMSFG